MTPAQKKFESRNATDPLTVGVQQRCPPSA